MEIRGFKIEQQLKMAKQEGSSLHKGAKEQISQEPSQYVFQILNIFHETIKRERERGSGIGYELQLWW